MKAPIGNLMKGKLKSVKIKFAKGGSPEIQRKDKMAKRK